MRLSRTPSISPTPGHLQLLLGRAGLWYAYEPEPAQDDWWPSCIAL
ncbi:hypothetical protein GTY51_28035 [Streptomyces sp. SID4936]|nr:hypothetical protein [Streptomyces sp. SID4936]